MILDKAKMAHDWFMKHGNPKTAKHSLFLAWDYADAMQAEEDKRKLKGLPYVLKMEDSPQLNNESILHNIDCYFDNPNNTKRDADNLIQSIYEHLTGEVRADVENTELSEWQPDWSKANEGFNWWAIDKCGDAYFYNYEPYINISGEYWADSNLMHEKGMSDESESFNYIGKWQDSLRKRP